MVDGQGVCAHRACCMRVAWSIRKCLNLPAEVRILSNENLDAMYIPLNVNYYVCRYNPLT